MFSHKIIFNLLCLNRRKFEKAKFKK